MNGRSEKQSSGGSGGTPDYSYFPSSRGPEDGNLYRTVPGTVRASAEGHGSFSLVLDEHAAGVGDAHSQVGSLGGIRGLVDSLGTSVKKLAKRMAHMTRWLLGWTWQSFTFAMIWLTLGAMGWLAWGPIPQPINFTGKVTVQPQATVPGGVIVVTREFNVTSPVVLTVTRTLVPVGEPKRPVYALTESRVLWNPGHYDNPRAHEIPDYIMPGKYRMDVVASWQANFLRHETQALTPIEFTVVEK